MTLHIHITEPPISEISADDLRRMDAERQLRRSADRANLIFHLRDADPDGAKMAAWIARARMKNVKDEVRA